MSPQVQSLKLPAESKLVGVDRPDRAPEHRSAVALTSGRWLAGIEPVRPDLLPN